MSETKPVAPNYLEQSLGAPAPAKPLQQFRVYTLGDTWHFGGKKPDPLPPGEYGIFALPRAGTDQRSVEDLRQFLQMPSAEKKAAVRYMWLRDPKRIPKDEPDGHLIVGPAGGEDVLWGEALDQRIDIDMGEQDVR